MIIARNLNLKSFNTLNIEYIGNTVFIVDNIYDLFILKYILNEFKIKHYIIGNGSKILFAKYTIIEPIIIIKPSNNYYLSNSELVVFAGEIIKNVTFSLLKQNIGGFHRLAYIPASFGGAIYMNASIKNDCISNYVKEVITIDSNNIIKKYNNNQCCFNYRHSIFQENSETILLIKLKVIDLEKEVLIKQISDEYRYRILNQGSDKYSCGSLFKNKNNIKAFTLIKQSNLEDYSVNDARFSNVHCNILINSNNATYKDVLDFISHIKAIIRKNYNINLELELNILN